MTPQPGIFAVGAPEHCYLELDAAPGSEPADLVGALAALLGPSSDVAGACLTVGVRPELWRAVAPGATPPDAASFEDVVGPELTMPATQHDAWVWIAGGSRSAVFDVAVTVTGALRPRFAVASEIGGWVYRTDRDLTGFVDGTENPSPVEAPDVAIRNEGPGEGSSVLLFQQWRHLSTFAELAVPGQERVIGRTKADSVELDENVMPADAHVRRNVIEEGGEELAIFRRNTSYGGSSDHGTVFVGFCASRHPLDRMLRRMAGVEDGVRDALTRYTVPLTGAYYVVPALGDLAGFAGLPEG